MADKLENAVSVAPAAPEPAPVAPAADPPSVAPIESAKEKDNTVTLLPQQPTRTGGVYIPPHKLRQLQEEAMRKEEKFGIQHQKYMWEMLRKSINGIVNKVNVSNIQNVILELLNENLIRGKGILVRAIMHSQMASPNFTHVYAALIAVINTKLPDHGRLLIHRYIQQFQRSFKRNNKLVCMATTKMLAHLVNQQVVHELLALEILALLLENPTEDSVEIAADFMIECGQVLSEITPAGVNAIFERFRGILHEGQIEKRVQYIIENLFAVRKNNFVDHPGVIPELDLVEEEDRIVHEVTLSMDLNTEDSLNIFHYDPNYEKTENEWQAIKVEILGEEEARLNKKQPEPEEEVAEEQEEDKNDPNAILDFSEKDLINLRRVIYLTIMSSVDFEECAHKLLKLNIREGQELELVNMIIECCMQERTYMKFFGLLAGRFCLISEVYKQKFQESFYRRYATLHRLDTNKLRNLAKMYAHLLYTDSIEWKVFECIKLTEEDTTSSSRIFIKIVFQELCEHMGLEALHKKLQDETLMEPLAGLFPKDDLKNTRFAINFFTSIGLGALTVELREFLQNAPALLLQQQLAALEKEVGDGADESSESGSSESGSDSESGSESSSSSVSSEEEEKPSPRKPAEKSRREKSESGPRRKEKREPEKRSERYRSKRKESESEPSLSEDSGFFSEEAKDKKNERKSRERTRRRHDSRSRSRSREHRRDRDRSRSRSRRRDHDRRKRRQMFSNGDFIPIIIIAAIIMVLQYTRMRIYYANKQMQQQKIRSIPDTGAGYIIETIIALLNEISANTQQQSYGKTKKGRECLRVRRQEGCQSLLPKMQNLHLSRLSRQQAY
eukprot:TRINITY_DN1135_c0_g1_i1.p1 TRINITY_DN1135_c0_g1~~TRINITY_DN1135_c0_g1_i1.p1  ORF type:complete len:843 (+),score=114.55 TRINITY_DN1135_c0_g1_i1:11264-13792(+)